MNDNSFPKTDFKNLNVRRFLTWYNPFTWIREGLLAPGDLLHAQWWSPPLALIYFIVAFCFKVRGKPVIFTVHNVFQHERIPLYNTVSRILFGLGDHFIVHSSSNKRQLTGYFNIPGERVSMIPHGPLDLHVKGYSDRQKIRGEFGFNQQDKVILLFGAIRPYKGIDTALHAFSEVVKQLPEARLLIAGKLWERWDRYEDIISDLNISDYIKKHFEYIPSNKVEKFFLAADLVLLPYHHFDSQSGVGATALAFNKPMIVTETGGLPELVADRMYIVPPKNPTELAEKVIFCLKDSARLAKMSEESRQIAKEISWDVIALKTLLVYLSVILAKGSSKKK
ncbi:MAG TPA: glycosyltransferase family 4 protein [Desulfatiglandales bacterium]|nr:glycosyltransferase family 4 protein [Desulfatiglandales bacterium]